MSARTSRRGSRSRLDGVWASTSESTTHFDVNSTGVPTTWSWFPAPRGPRSRAARSR